MFEINIDVIETTIASASNVTSEEYVDLMKTIMDRQDSYFQIFIAILSVILVVVGFYQWKIQDDQVRKIKLDIEKQLESEAIKTDNKINAINDNITKLISSNTSPMLLTYSEDLIRYQNNKEHRKILSTLGYIKNLLINNQYIDSNTKTETISSFMFALIDVFEDISANYNNDEYAEIVNLYLFARDYTTEEEMAPITKMLHEQMIFSFRILKSNIINSDNNVDDEELKTIFKNVE